MYGCWDHWVGLFVSRPLFDIPSLADFFILKQGGYRTPNIVEILAFLEHFALASFQDWWSRLFKLLLLPWLKWVSFPLSLPGLLDLYKSECGSFARLCASFPLLHFASCADPFCTLCSWKLGLLLFIEERGDDSDSGTRFIIRGLAGGKVLLINMSDSLCNIREPDADIAQSCHVWFRLCASLI